ncbi:hypothetical protein Plec18167_006675 [Paecilomyces lecythidis]|uniref:Uncharacterized protein n=1 Tax=Paecilomyces lecythidis TaxID=3004212 RepID=A0ABR3XA45_9EURO
MSDFVDEFSLNDLQRMLESDDVNFDDWINYEDFDTMIINGSGLQASQAPFDQAVQVAHEESNFPSDYDHAALTVNEIASQERMLEPQSAPRGDMDPPSISPPAAKEASKKAEHFEFTPHARVLEDRRPKGKGRSV